MATQKKVTKGNKVTSKKVEKKVLTPAGFEKQMTKKFQAAEKASKASKKTAPKVTEPTPTAPVTETAPVVAPVPVVTAPVVAPKATKEPKAPVVKARHPNLPPVGTKIITHWKKQECVAVEQADGSFLVSLAGKTLGTFETLSKGAAEIIRTAHPESTWEPSSFGWWELRTPKKVTPAPESK